MLLVVGALNGCIAFGVPGKNDNGRRLVEFCAERGLYVGNTFLSTGVYICTKGWQGSKMEWK